MRLEKYFKLCDDAKKHCQIMPNNYQRQVALEAMQKAGWLKKASLADNENQGHTRVSFEPSEIGWERVNALIILFNELASALGATLHLDELGFIWDIVKDRRPVQEASWPKELSKFPSDDGRKASE
jgi:hypothetical protein